MEKNSNSILERAKKIKVIVDLKAKQKILKERLREKAYLREIEKDLGIKPGNAYATANVWKGKLYKNGKLVLKNGPHYSHEKNIECLENKYYKIISIDIYNMNDDNDKGKILEIYNKIKSILYDDDIKLNEDAIQSLIINLLEIKQKIEDIDIKKEICDILTDFSKKTNISFINYDEYFDFSKKEDRLLIQSVYLNQSEFGYLGNLFEFKVFDLSEEDEKENLREVIYNLSVFHKVTDIPEEIYDLNDTNQKIKFLETKVNLLEYDPERVKRKWQELVDNDTLNPEISYLLENGYSFLTDPDVLSVQQCNVKRYVDFLTGRNKLARDRIKDDDKDEIEIVETGYMFENIKKFYDKARAIVPSFRKDSLVGVDKEDTLKKQKSILLDILKVLQDTGCLEDLVKKQKIEINELLSDKNKITKNLSVDGFINQVKEMDNDLDIAIYLRHFANKLSHNIEDFGFFVFYNDYVNNTDRVKKVKRDNLNKVNHLLDNAYRKDLINFSSILIDTVGMEDVEYRQGEYENLLKKIGKNIANPNVPMSVIKSQVEVLFDQHYKFDENTFTQVVVSYFKEFEEIEGKHKLYNNDNGIRCDYFSFSEFLKEYIKTESYNKEKKDNYFRKIFEEKFSNNPEILERLDTILNKVLTDSRFTDRDKLVETLAEYMDIKAASFQIKQLLNVQLAEVAKQSDEILFQNSVDKNGDGIVEVAYPGYIQVFGSHYKLHESKLVNDELSAFPEVDKEITDVFEKNLRAVSVQIPLQRLTQEQIEEFRGLYEIIHALEFNENVDEEKYDCKRNGEDINLYRKLKDLRDNDKNKYEAYRLQILLGSGINYYKSFIREVRSKNNETERYSNEQLEDALGHDVLLDALEDSKVGTLLMQFDKINQFEQGDDAK